jgi:hypothetical protein
MEAAQHPLLDSLLSSNDTSQHPAKADAIEGVGGDPDSSSNCASTSSQDLSWVDLGLSSEDQVGPMEEIRAPVEELDHRWRSPVRCRPDR